MSNLSGTVGDDHFSFETGIEKIWGGSAGYDTLTIDGLAAQYKIFDNYDGSLSLIALDAATGTSATIVRDVELFQFVDASFSFDEMLERARTEHHGTDGADTLNGTSADDKFFGLEGDDRVWGGADGQDTLVLSGSLADYAIYDQGDGSFRILHQPDGVALSTKIVRSIETFEFDDGAASLGQFIEYFSENGTNYISGTDGSDNIIGTEFNDLVVSASGGNDTIWGGVGGIDTLVFSGRLEDYHIEKLLDCALSFRDLRPDSPDGIDRVRDIEIFQFADQTLTFEQISNVRFDRTVVTDGDDIIYGTSLSDTIAGGDGNDRIFGLMSGDYIDGGDGIDAVDYHSSEAGVTINLAEGTASGGEADGDVLVNIESTYGSNLYDDVLIGDEHDNFFCGLGGQDQLFGGDGNDTLRGAQDGDLIDGGAGFDTSTYWASSDGVIVDLATGTGSAGTAAGDQLISIERVVGSNTGDDVLFAGEFDTTLSGSGGDDQLFGRSGNDVLQGGDGNDQLAGGTGDDALSGGNEDDWLVGGDGHDSVLGDAGHDVLEGGNGADSLFGGEGDDRLVGGAGDDILRGGGGADTFVFTEATGRDTIRDFGAGADRLDVSGLSVAGAPLILDAMVFIGTASFSGRAGEIAYAVSGDVTEVMLDLTGDGRSDVAITLEGEHTLAAIDFIV